MDNNIRAQLLKLIEELNIPILPEEAEEKLGKLPDAEVQKLIDVYQKVKDYNDKVNALAKEANPEEYKKIEEQEKLEMDAAEAEYNEKMRKTNEETDDKLDEIDKETMSSIDKSTEKTESELKDIEDLTNELTEKINSSIPKEE